MGFMSISSRFRRRMDDAIYPYFGTAPWDLTQPQKNGAFIKSLGSRGLTADRNNASFTLDCPSGSGLTMYYAYPVAYGQATFLDVESTFEGGWDGASGDWGQTLGPIIVPVDINGVMVDFYLYQTDFEELGSVEWSVY